MRVPPDQSLTARDTAAMAASGSSLHTGHSKATAVSVGVGEGDGVTDGVALGEGVALGDAEGLGASGPELQAARARAATAMATEANGAFMCLR